MSAVQWEQRVIKAIQTGSLDELKKCCLGKADVNRPISLSQDVPIVSQSRQCPFSVIHAPTPVVYTILCEQPELLDYLLRVKSGDLSVRVQGWAPIHYAACTGSHKCLEVLLRYKFTWENIDIPVDEPAGVPRKRSPSTTALHVAVTNRRHAAAILLTEDPTTPFIDSANDEVGHFIPQRVDIHAFTTFGNAPIHIAARQNDWDMCQILLNAGADLTLRNDQGKTAIDIAREFHYNDLAEKLEKNKFMTLCELKLKYLGEEDDGDAGPKNDSDDEGSNSQIARLMWTIRRLENTVRYLENRVSALEAQRYTGAVAPQVPRVSSGTVNLCCVCGSPSGEKCEQCSLSFCPTCRLKSQHACVLPK